MYGGGRGANLSLAGGGDRSVDAGGVDVAHGGVGDINVLVGGGGDINVLVGGGGSGGGANVGLAGHHG